MADLDRLQAFLSEKDADAGNRAMVKLSDAIDSLLTFPERGRPSVLTNWRELIVKFGQSAYVVRYVYRAQTDAVHVYRIWHGRELRE